MEKENIFWRRRKRRKIVGEGIYFLAEEKEEGNDWRKIYFCRGEGRGGKYLGNNNFFLRRR